MPAWRVRDYLGEEVWRSYFKFAFDRNPWDRQVSWYLYKTKSKRARPSFESFMASRRRAYVDNYQLYTIEGALAVDFLGRYERLEEDLNTALELAGVAAARRGAAHQHHAEQGRGARLSQLLLARNAGAGGGVVSARNRAAGLWVLRGLPGDNQSRDKLRVADPRRPVTVTDRRLPRWTIKAEPVTPWPSTGPA